MVESDARVGSVNRLRIALDLDGSLEYLANSMTDLANALERRDDLDLVRFRSRSASRGSNEVRVRARRLYEPFWRHSWGPSIDDIIEGVDLVHVAGVATPPTHRVPLVISVDDLRPLRRRRSDTQRVVQLVRAVRRGATLVVASHAARHEIQSMLGLERSEVLVVKPVVGHVPLTRDGNHLVISVAGETRRLMEWVPALQTFSQSRHARVAVVGSNSLRSSLRGTFLDGHLLSRRQAAEVIARARVVVSLTDGARFPSFAVAALAAGVPTVALASTTVREVLSGAATLVESPLDALGAVEELWEDSATRRICIAAGVARASDYSAPSVASAYAQLYHAMSASVSR